MFGVGAHGGSIVMWHLTSTNGLYIEMQYSFWVRASNMHLQWCNIFQKHPLCLPGFQIWVYPSHVCTTSG